MSALHKVQMKKLEKIKILVQTHLEGGKQMWSQEL